MSGDEKLHLQQAISTYTFSYRSWERLNVNEETSSSMDSASTAESSDEEREQSRRLGNMWSKMETIMKAHISTFSRLATTFRRTLLTSMRGRVSVLIKMLPLHSHSIYQLGLSCLTVTELLKRQSRYIGVYSFV